MIYCLGPAGSYTEKAARVFSKLIYNEDIKYCSSIYEVFEMVEKDKNSYGVVPSENSIEGSVALTQDLLFEFPVRIFGEVHIDINHCLIGYEMKSIKQVISHPQALAQCRRYIKKHGWETLVVSSTAKAVEIVFESKNKELAAIGPEEAAKIYNLKVLDENIQDYPNNKTRFILIGHENAKNPICLNKSPQKSSIIIGLKENKPGALYRVLKEFADRNINLTRIESRPSKTELGNYIFYIDYEYYFNEDDLLKCLQKHVSFITHLGSYSIFL